MNSEINLLDRLPPVKRDLARRAAGKTPEDRAIAKRFDQDFFDGERFVSLLPEVQRKIRH